jgi:hypothetical protein
MGMDGLRGWNKTEKDRIKIKIKKLKEHLIEEFID